MKLYENGLVELDYDINADILTVNWPDLQRYSLVEIDYVFRLLIETIKNYDVKNLLIDSSQTASDIYNEEYQALVHQISKDFTTTRLQKMARIVSPNPIRESQVAATQYKLQNNIHFNFAYQNFTDKGSALAWLKSKIQ